MHARIVICRPGSVKRSIQSGTDSTATHPRTVGASLLAIGFSDKSVAGGPLCPPGALPQIACRHAPTSLPTRDYQMQSTLRIQTPRRHNIPIRIPNQRLEQILRKVTIADVPRVIESADLLALVLLPHDRV